MAAGDLCFVVFGHKCNLGGCYHDSEAGGMNLTLMLAPFLVNGDSISFDQRGTSHNSCITTPFNHFMFIFSDVKITLL